ncbi:MAG: hypothetical protein ACM3SQ_09400 [Betaproteobacteria bacterium]
MCGLTGEAAAQGRLNALTGFVESHGIGPASNVTRERRLAEAPGPDSLPGIAEYRRRDPQFWSTVIGPEKERATDGRQGISFIRMTWIRGEIACDR